MKGSRNRGIKGSRPAPSKKAGGADRARVSKIIAQLEQTHADAKLALDYATPLELLVALILAAQCTDAKVNEVTRSLFRRYRSARDFAGATQEALEEAVRQTGFFRQKAKAIRACCQQLVERFAGEVPQDLDALLTLPGVGRKTANILRGNAFGIPGIGVDTHVSRLAQRLGLTRQQDPDKIEADLVQLVPTADQIRFCHLLQYHGRRVCFARKPDCPKCSIVDLCPYRPKTRAPVPKPSPQRSRWVG
jgi:endonuclease-3